MIEVNIMHPLLFSVSSYVVSLCIRRYEKNGMSNAKPVHKLDSHACQLWFQLCSLGGPSPTDLTPSLWFLR